MKTKHLNWMLMLLIILVNPIVIMNLWNWFIVELGAKPINYLLAFGLDLFMTYMIYKPSVNEDTEEDIINKQVQSIFLMILFSVGGFIIHLFM
ncbi:hypothetical protein [Weissella koreensis]|uniref:hypothetical protein n=1 Tax=Weissella koreensis TaxID=165096 RepID=UPI000CF35EF5|nr:hypothetical protein [Weissella koreensis]AVH74727.1 hypothetical protein C4597_01260 [Weissella koreensis]QGN19949.1 hypothetical protein GKC51_01230 [Weissella koreensis]